MKNAEIRVSLTAVGAFAIGEAMAKKGLSVRQAAKEYAVSTATACRCAQVYEVCQTGKINPKRYHMTALVAVSRLPKTEWRSVLKSKAPQRDLLCMVRVLAEESGVRARRDGAGRVVRALRPSPKKRRARRTKKG